MIRLLESNVEREMMKIHPKMKGHNGAYTISSIISLWGFFQTLKGSELRSPWLDLTEFRTRPSACKNEEDPIKNGGECSQGFHHYNPKGDICCHGNQSSDSI